MRKAGFILFLAIWVGETALAQDPEPAILELTTLRAECFVGERIDLQYRLVYDPEFFGEYVVQPFRSPLDLPVQWTLPSHASLPVTTEVGDLVSPKGPSFVLNGERHTGSESTETRIDGKPFRVLEIVRRLYFHRPGHFIVPGGSLKYSRATSFSEDLINGRVPLGIQTVQLSAPDLVLQIQGLPAEGRPSSFSGAIGLFDMAVSTDVRDVKVGESFSVTVALAGAGNLARIDPPHLEAPPGFRILGSLAGAGDFRREFRYDFVATQPTREGLPPIEISVFEPDPPARYRTLRGFRLPIVVEGEALGGTLDEVDSALPRPSRSRARWTRTNFPNWWLWLGLSLPWLALLGLQGLGRLRRRLTKDPDVVRIQESREALERCLKSEDSDPAAAFCAYIASRLRCAVPSVIDPNLAPRLVAAGLEEELAVEAARGLEILVAASYGGAVPAQRGDFVRSLLRRLEAGFQTGGAS